MKYCINTTTNHVFATTHNSCLNSINALIFDEGYTGPNPTFVNSEIIINLDIAEAIIAKAEKRPQNKSMDVAFGLRNNSSTVFEMLMVEFKFNVTELYNIKKRDLEGKVAGSSLILKNSPPIHNLYIFIFMSNHVQEAKNRLMRMIPIINSNYVAMDINRLKALYF